MVGEGAPRLRSRRSRSARGGGRTSISAPAARASGLSRAVQIRFVAASPFFQAAHAALLAASEREHQQPKPIKAYALDPRLSAEPPSFYMHDLRSVSRAAWTSPDSTEYSPIGQPGRILFGARGALYLSGRARLRQDFRQLAIMQSSSLATDDAAILRHPLAFAAHVLAQTALVMWPVVAELQVTLPAPDDGAAHAADRTLVIMVTNPLGITVIDVLSAIVDGYVCQAIVCCAHVAVSRPASIVQSS